MAESWEYILLCLVKQGIQDLFEVELEEQKTQFEGLD
jgi:hypothetical protein